MACKYYYRKQRGDRVPVQNYTQKREEDRVIFADYITQQLELCGLDDVISISCGNLTNQTLEDIYDFFRFFHRMIPRYGLDCFPGFVLDHCDYIGA